MRAIDASVQCKSAPNQSYHSTIERLNVYVIRWQVVRCSVDRYWISDELNRKKKPAYHVLPIANAHAIIFEIPICLSMFVNRCPCRALYDNTHNVEREKMSMKFDWMDKSKCGCGNLSDTFMLHGQTTILFTFFPRAWKTTIEEKRMIASKSAYHKMTRRNPETKWIKINIKLLFDLNVTFAILIRIVQSFVQRNSIGWCNGGPIPFHFCIYSICEMEIRSFFLSKSHNVREMLPCNRPNLNEIDEKQ